MLDVTGATTSAASLAELERILREYDGTSGTAARKRTCLGQLESKALSSSRQVLRLHEALCFLRAYPDDEAVLEQVERMLAGFATRRDTRRFRRDLADTGIAGTDLHFAFFQPQASWLARRYGAALSIDWKEYEEKERLRGWLEAFVLETEVPALYDVPRSIEAWVDALKGPDETDAQFLIRSIDALPAPASARRSLHDGLDVPYRIDARLGAPSRSLARHARSPVVFREQPLRGARPDLARAVRARPQGVRECAPDEARELIELTRDAMATRTRDLDSFSYANPHDVRMVDLGDGIELAWMGILPEQRIVLEALYAGVMLQNGVPTGYTLASALYRSSDVAYNVFETFRGGEAAHVYGRVLAAIAALLGSDTFSITPYQLGHKNEEGLASGAWWFYQKLGFQSDDPDVLELMRSELAAMRGDRKHRSSRGVLNALSAKYVFWSRGRVRQDVIGRIPLDRISLKASALVAQRFGSDRRRARRVLPKEAAARCGVSEWKRWPVAERTAFERWSPLILLLPGVERWSAGERRALAAVARAKGAPRETDYLALFEKHTKLKRALLRIAD